ncbi:hypothetical protein MYX07_06835 [Patescibacteria group bacterium AH-259-L07]|nr:hypothetical protein [Patescibacteria group bacterium AH-259-L07]
MKIIKPKNYTKDKYYPTVCKDVGEVLKKQNYVSPIDLFIQCGRLDRKKYEEWRLKKVPYLEKAIRGRLSTLNRILRILRCHARKIGLKESMTVYKSWGKGRKILLRFSRSDKNHVERLYFTHYVVKKKRMGQLNKTGT